MRQQDGDKPSVSRFQGKKEGEIITINDNIKG